MSTRIKKRKTWSYDDLLVPYLHRQEKSETAAKTEDSNPQIPERGMITIQHQVHQSTGEWMTSKKLTRRTVRSQHSKQEKKQPTTHQTVSSLAFFTGRGRATYMTTDGRATDLITQRGDDEMLTSRSERIHFGSISQTSQVKDDRNTRRATATTHVATTTTRPDEDARANAKEKRAAAATDADASRERCRCGSVSRHEIDDQPRHASTERHEEDANAKKTTTYEDDTTATTMPAPCRTPKAVPCQGGTAKEEKRGKYRAIHGDVPISSTTQPQ